MVARGSSPSAVQKTICELERQNELMVKQYQAFLSMKEALSEMIKVTAQREDVLLQDNQMLKSALGNIRHCSSQGQVNKSESAWQENQTDFQSTIPPQMTSPRISRSNMRESVPRTPTQPPMIWVPSRSHSNWEGAFQTTAPPSVWMDPSTSNTWEACD